MHKTIARIQNARTALTTAVVVGSAAALTAAHAAAGDPLISATDMTGLQTSWQGAATVGVPALLGIFGIKLGADFLVRRASRMGK